MMKEWKWGRKLTLDLYGSTFGPRRFLMLDWWRAKLGIRPERKRPIAFSSGASAYLILHGTMEESLAWARERLQPSPEFLDKWIAKAWSEPKHSPWCPCEECKSSRLQDKALRIRRAREKTELNNNHKGTL